MFTVKLNESFVLVVTGGAYYVANAASHRIITIQVSRACNARVLAINYRLAPETRFPGPLHDAGKLVRTLEFLYTQGKCEDVADIHHLPILQLPPTFA